MRTVLAAAAAGALIMGSAAGAAVAKGKPAATSAPQEGRTLQSVRIRSTYTTASSTSTPRPSTATSRCRLYVRDTVKASDPTDVSVVAGASTTAKGTAADPRLPIPDQVVPLRSRARPGRSPRCTAEWLRATPSPPSSRHVLTPGTTIFICLTRSATLKGDHGQGCGQAGGQECTETAASDCFRVVQRGLHAPHEEQDGQLADHQRLPTHLSNMSRSRAQSAPGTSTRLPRSR